MCYPKLLQLFSLPEVKTLSVLFISVISLSCLRRHIYSDEWVESRVSNTVYPDGKLIYSPQQIPFELMIFL